MHQELLIAGHFIGGSCDQSVGKEVVRNPFDGSVIGTVAEGGWSELNTAIESAHDAFITWRSSSLAVRQALLRRIAALVTDRADELTDLLVLEIGKPVKWAQGEVMRLALTFELAAKELDQWGSEIKDISSDPRSNGYSAQVQRDPMA